MQLLLLGPYRQNLIDFFVNCGDQTITFEQKLTSNSSILEEVDFLISYGYRYILPDDVLAQFFQKAINIHISFLPWNKGADPNLWSFLEDTPKGVTIHYIDSGIDTGDIILQTETSFSTEDTLKTSYLKLSEIAEQLLKKNWVDICQGKITAFPQPSGGSNHRLKDKSKYEHLLVHGWDTSVRDLIGKAL